MPTPSPGPVVLAGSNGARKSTMSRSIVRDELGILDFVNADAIALGLSAFDPERAAVAAGRVMLHRLDELAKARADFALETTLASRSCAPWIAALRRDGYSFQLIFVSLPSSHVALARVRKRVAAGGHSIPEDVIKRRHERGLSNFFALYRPLADEWRFFDNAQDCEPTVIARGGAGKETQVLDENSWKRFEPPPEMVRERTGVVVQASSDPIQRAAARGVREALLRHKLLGQSVVVWRDGRVVEVPPDQIQVRDEEPEDAV